MDARHIALIQQSFEQTAAFGDRLSELFYAELFAIDPSLRAMFDGDMRRQQMKYMMMVALIVRSLHKPEDILITVQHLAIKHVGYGVRPDHSAMRCFAHSKRFSARTTRAMSPMPGKKASECLPVS